MGDAIAQLATEIDVATHRLLTHIREFERKGGWHTAGCLSCANWLSWRIGMGLGAAREKVRVAKRLAELPLIDTAFGQGQVSYSKVRAMTRVATPENEEQLVVLAINSTAAQLRQPAMESPRRRRGFRGAAQARTQPDVVRRYWPHLSQIDCVNSPTA